MGKHSAQVIGTIAISDGNRATIIYDEGTLVAVLPDGTREYPVERRRIPTLDAARREARALWPRALWDIHFRRKRNAPLKGARPRENPGLVGVIAGNPPNDVDKLAILRRARGGKRGFFVAELVGASKDGGPIYHTVEGGTNLTHEEAVALLVRLRTQPNPGSRRRRGRKRGPAPRPRLSRGARGEKSWTPSRNPPQPGEGPGQNIRNAIAILGTAKITMSLDVIGAGEGSGYVLDTQSFEAAMHRLRVALRQVESGHLGNPARRGRGRLIGVAHSLKYQHTTEGRRQHPFETTAHVYCMPGGSIEIRSPRGLPLWQERR